MNKQSSKSVIDKAFEEGTPIDNAIKRAMRKAAIMHKKLGNSVAGIRNGKMVIIPAEEITIPEESD